MPAPDSQGMPDFSLTGKRALITGATQGLGRTIAQAYAACGAAVIINSRDGERARMVADDIRAQGGQADIWHQDIGRLEHLQDSYASLCSEVGTPDILVNNVGMRIRKTLESTTLDEITLMMNVNLIASVQLSRLAASAMVATGRAGRIITLTSIAGELARHGDGLYPVAKQGLAGLVRALAVEFGPQNITSNGIAPGTFATETNASLAADPVRGPIVVGRNPLGRWAQPAEITGAAVFLASPAASYVNGHILVVDGGFSVTF